MRILKDEWARIAKDDEVVETFADNLQSAINEELTYSGESTNTTIDISQEAKKDAGKPRLTLVPTQILYDICKVREFAVDTKYKDPDNWRKVDIQRYRDAAFRHFLLYLQNPKGVDEESGLPHYYHLACNIAFICELEKEAPKTTPADEIYKKMIHTYKEAQCVSKHDSQERSRLSNEAACLADSFMDLYECWDAADDHYIMADLISKARAVCETKGGD